VVFDVTGHNVTIAAGTLQIGNGNNTAGGGAVGTLSFDTGTISALNTSIGLKSGPAGTGTGAGTLNIGGTGAFTVGSGGSLVLATNSATGVATGTVNITGGTLTSNADITKGGGTATTATLTLAGGSLNLTGHNIGSAAQTINNLNFQSGTLANVLQINNGAALNKTTAGTLIVAGTNSYTGGTNIQAGTLQNGGPNALPATTALTIGSTGIAAIYDLNGFSSQVGSLLTSGTASSQTVTNNGASPAALTVANAAGDSFAGLISNGVSQTSIIKSGSGALTLTGGNTYNGTTAVNQGILFANNTTGSATGSGAVTVATGATVGGSGTIAGTATINGNLAPAGNGTAPLGVGPLTVAGAVTFNTGSTFTVNLVTPATPGVSYDKVVYGSTVAAGTGNPTLVLNDLPYLNAPPTPGDTFWVLDGGSAANTNLVPVNLFGSTVSDSTGNVFAILYNQPGDPTGAPGNVELVAPSTVPEPGTLGMLGVGALGLLARRRRIARRR
jgi:autotransporter-associated beta strand protein